MFPLVATSHHFVRPTISRSYSVVLNFSVPMNYSSKSLVCRTRAYCVRNTLQLAIKVGTKDSRQDLYLTTWHELNTFLLHGTIILNSFHLLVVSSTLLEIDASVAILWWHLANRKKTLLLQDQVGGTHRQTMRPMLHVTLQWTQSW